MGSVISNRDYIESKLGILALVEEGGISPKVAKALDELRQACTEFEEQTGVLIRSSNFIDEYTFSHLLFGGDVNKKEYILASKISSCRDSLLDIIEDRFKALDESQKRESITRSLLVTSTRDVEKSLYSALKSAITASSSVSQDECMKLARTRIRKNIDLVFDNYEKIQPNAIYCAAHKERCDEIMFFRKDVRDSAFENAALQILIKGIIV